MQYIDDNVIDYAAWANRPTEAAHVRPASHWCEEVIKKFHDPDKKVSISIPFLPPNNSNFAFRPQEVTVWAGVNGHGKTAILSACALYWAAHAERICIASFEMTPVTQLERMVQQATGQDLPSPDLIRRFHKWTDDAIWIYNKLGSVEAKRVIDLGHYVHDELKCTHLIIDSLMGCKIPSDGFGWLTAQKNFMASLCELAKSTNLHIHLVTHSRKGENENKAMDKMDVRGAAELTDMTDNLILIKKNITKTDAVSCGEASYEQSIEPDFNVTVAKQRHGRWTGKIPLWIAKNGMQFLRAQSADPPKPWVE